MLSLFKKQLNAVQINAVNETLTRAVYTNFVRAGDHVLDLGANHGDHTKDLATLVGPYGLVHAFEPNYKMLPELSAIPNTRVWAYAAGDMLSIEHLHVPTGLDGWASLQDIRSELPAREFELLTVIQAPLDYFDEIKFDKITFAKIDVERRELQALSGMTKLLNERRAILVIENANDEIKSFLAKYDYRVIPMMESIDLSNSIALPCKASANVIIPTKQQISEALAFATSIQ